MFFLVLCGKNFNGTCGLKETMARAVVHKGTGRKYYQGRGRGAKSSFEVEAAMLLWAVLKS